MIGPAGRWSPSPTQAELSRRCQALSLPLWWCDRGGHILQPPEPADGVDRWLQSSWLSPRVGDAARDRPSPDTVELFDGCVLVALPLEDCVAVALALGGGATSHPEFGEACRDAGVDPAAAARALAPFTRPGAFDPGQLATVLLAFAEDLGQRSADQGALAEFSARLSGAYEQVNLMFRMARFLNHVTDPVAVMRMTCNQVRDILPFAWITLRFRDVGSTMAPLRGLLIHAGEIPCDLAAFDRLAEPLAERLTLDDWTQVLAPGTNPLATAVGSEVLAEPIAHDGRCVGILLAGNKRGADPEIGSEEIQFLDAAAEFLGLFHENMSRYAEQQAQFLGTLRGLTAAIEAKDPYTCGHSDRVGLLASELARAVGLGAAEVERHRTAGLLHDIGKIGVPEAVLRKQGRLTPAEFAEIKRHPGIGYQILKDIPSMGDLLPGVLHHHERWDGHGYPAGLEGEGIPRIARLLALADTFDAMTSHRSYRKAMGRDQALEEIRRCAGTQFDPDLVGPFLSLDFTEFDEMLRAHRATETSAA